jgi:hypothetical protein
VGQSSDGASVLAWLTMVHQHMYKHRLQQPQVDAIHTATCERGVDSSAIYCCGLSAI